MGLITGPAGLGKTTFVVRAAHALRSDFPDGMLFLDLFGMLEVLAACLAEEGQAGESRRACARAAAVFETIGDAGASSRCHDLAAAAV